MSDKSYQALATQYYRLTGETYRQLDPQGTDFMNFVLWPAASIAHAQKALYLALVDNLQIAMAASDSHASVVEQIVELGCGWGGGVEVLLESFSQAIVTGINLSADQTEYCRKTYRDQRCRFLQDFYEHSELGISAATSVAIGVESLLHCGNRADVFEMFQRNEFDYIALAEILLIDEEARTHRLFNPALKFAAEFTEYQKLFDDFGYDVVINSDLSARVFKPWARALREKTATLSGIHKKIKEQFIESYSALADLSEQGRAKYLIIVAKKRNARD